MASTYQQLDPNTATRRQFSHQLINHEPPENATAEYKHYSKTMTDLLDALLHHDAMAENIDQTFMTPANYKNKVYFMWDFVGRTLGMLYSPLIDPTNPRGEQWEEVTGRALYSDVLIKDSGKLDIMCPDQRGRNTQFGDKVVDLSAKVASWGQ